MRRVWRWSRHSRKRTPLPISWPRAGAARFIRTFSPESNAAGADENVRHNILATSIEGDEDNIVFAGAHSDSVQKGPGINDNASGSVALLEIALQLAKYDLKNKVRFGWWTAEEYGLLGSTHYVSTLDEEELNKIRLYLNFDMIASGNGIIGR